MRYDDDSSVLVFGVILWCVLVSLFIIFLHKTSVGNLRWPKLDFLDLAVKQIF